MPRPKNPAAAPVVVSIADAMAMLGVSRSTIGRLVRDRDLDATYVGTHPRILVASILDYVERNATKG